MDFVYECNSNERDQSHGNSQGNNALGQGELILVDIFVPILISTLVVLEDIVVNTMVGLRLEKDKDNIGHEQEDGDDARQASSPFRE